MLRENLEWAKWPPAKMGQPPRQSDARSYAPCRPVLLYVCHGLEAARRQPAPGLVVGRVPGREVARQKAPGRAGTDDPAQGITATAATTSSGVRRRPTAAPRNRGGGARPSRGVRLGSGPGGLTPRQAFSGHARFPGREGGGIRAVDERRGAFQRRRTDPGFKGRNQPQPRRRAGLTPSVDRRWSLLLNIGSAEHRTPQVLMSKEITATTTLPYITAVCPANATTMSSNAPAAALGALRPS